MKPGPCGRELIRVLNAGVESIMVSTVAEALGNRQKSSNDFLDLECSFRDIIKYSGARRRAGPQACDT